MSAYQKQTLLDTLAQYTTSSDALKQVMNSPGADKRGGKIMSQDGTKAIFSNQNGFKSQREKGGKRGQGEKGKKNNQNNQTQGPSNKPNQPKAKKPKSDKVSSLIHSRMY